MAKKKYSGKSYGKGYGRGYVSYATTAKETLWMLMQNMDVICSMLMIVLTLYIFIRRRFSATWTPGKKS